MKILSIAVLALVFSLASAQARTLEQIKKAGVIRVAVDGDTPPFNYFKGKDLVGFDVDVAQEFANRLGVKVEWVAQSFNTLLVALNQDRFDVIATAHTITPARQKVVDFLRPHYCTGVVIVSKPGGPKTSKELVGKTISVPVGTVYYDKLKTVPGIKQILTVPSETDAMQGMLSGRADAWATDQFVALDAIAKLKNQKLEVGETLMAQQNAMVVSKGNTSLLAELNKQLDAIFKDHTYDKLEKKYFTQDIRCKQ